MKAFCPTSSFRIEAERSPLRCPITQHPLEYDDLPVFVPDKIDPAQMGHWRYAAMLPLIGGSNSRVSLGEGWTPLIADNFLGQKIYWKVDTQMPTGSYKDRGVSVMINWMLNLGASRVVEDSSGNAGASVACYAARSGIRACIYVPETAPEPKKAQIAVYGAELVEVPGPRSAAADAAVAATRLDKGTKYASHSYHPAYLLGQMTCAWEIWEQLDRQTPDWLVAPVGHGVLLLGIWRGFQHLQKSGIISKLPRLLAVQAEPYTPLVNAFNEGLDKIQHPPRLFECISADGISISNPVRGTTLLAAIRHSNGSVLTTTDDEILVARDELARRGLFVEPTSAVVGAAIRKSKSLFRPDQTVVAVLSGHGLKRLPDDY